MRGELTMRNLKRFFLFCLLGILLLLIASCNCGNDGPIETEVAETEAVETEIVETKIVETEIVETETVETEVTPTGELPTPFEGTRVCDPLTRAQSNPSVYSNWENLFLIPNQLIFIGDEDYFDSVVGQFESAGISLEGLDQIDFVNTDDYISPLSSSLFRLENGIDLNDDQIRTDIQSVINQIYAETISDGLPVFIDFNYIIGRPVTADPDGDSGGANPDPDGGPGSPATINFYYDQWAFDQINLHGGNANQYGDSVVDVAIFDTSPYRASNEELSLFGISPNMAYNIHWAEPDLELCISDPLSIENLPYDDRFVDISDHGLFVAGLVHGVAPQSNIELVRVLDNYGHGDTYSLIKVLMLYANRAISSNGGAKFPLNDTVINLSLGIDVEDKYLLQVDGELEGYLQEILEGTYGISPDQSLRVIPLQLPFHLLHEMGAVIVAASGNDSLRGFHESMQIPAEYVDVIGVAASNIGGKIACFSNMGQVMAPGGDSPNPSCKAAVMDLCDPSSGHCEFALVSLSHKYPSGYAFWKGTSFATPLVSGMAALMMDRCNGISLEDIAATIPFDPWDTFGITDPPIIDISGTLAGITCP
jgi:hypothetical protein